MSEEPLEIKLSRHAFARIVATIMVGGAGLVLVKTLTIVLSQEDFGLYSLWKAFAVFAYVSSTGAFVQSIQRYIQGRRIRNKQGASRLFSASLLGSFSVLLGTLFVLLMAYILGGFRIIDDPLYLVSLAVVALLMIFQVIERIVLGISDSEQDPREAFIFSLSYGLVSSVGAMLFALLFGEFRLVFVGLIVGHTVPALVSLRAKIREYRLAAPNRADFKQIITYGGPVLAEEVAGSSVVFIVSYIASLWLGLTGVALLSIALVIAGILLTVIGPPLAAYMAYLVQAYETESYEDANHLNRRLLEICLVAIPALMCVVIVCSPLLIQIISTPEYLDAALLVPFTIMANVLLLFSNLWKYALRLSERTHIIAAISLVSVGILVVLCVVLVPSMGLIGIGLALIGRALFELLCINRAVKSSMRITVERRFQMAWVGALLALVGSYGILYMWSLHWFTSVIGSILIYSLVAWKLGILELTDVFRLLKRALSYPKSTGSDGP